MLGKILAIDDEIDMLSLLKRIIEGKTDYEVTVTPEPKRAIRLIQDTYFDLVLLDLKMPGMSGMEVLRKIKEIEPDTAVIIITAYGTIESAVEAMKIGAVDFITKPFKPEQILLTIQRTMELQKLKRENKALKEELAKEKEANFIIGKSKVMQSIYRYILQVAKTSATVVISGESGTGKELVARALHHHSLRSSKPFVPVNCSAIPETLIESEFFGHVRGAFSGAIRDKIGLVGEANGGTLFLDEVSDLNLLMQTKLLRFLQDGEFRPVGSTKNKRADTRIIAATNRDLLELVKQGRFREDLYYRLNVISIHLPPLRERREDIPILAHYFLEKYAKANKKSIKGFSQAAMSKLMTRDWPGNIRELQNVIERAVIVCQGEYIQASEIDPLTSLQSESSTEEIWDIPLKKAKRRILVDFYHQYLSYVLRQCKGNVSEAAKICGVKRQYLHRLMKIANLKSSSFRD